MAHFNLSDINGVNSIMNDLFKLFKMTLNPDLTYREFHQYFFGIHPERLEISFIYKDEELAGFCTSGAYPKKVNGKRVVILRSAFGLLDEYKKGKFPLHGLFYKYMRYKLSHPFTKVYVTGFMANPLMYAMICKYTLNCYPRRNQDVSEEMTSFADDLLESMNLLRKKVSPFVVKIHFQVKFRQKDIERFTASEDEDVRYFLEINPGYNNQEGVLVLVPVTIKNMSYTFIRYLLRGVRKKIQTPGPPAKNQSPATA
jgi:hypothetical protein